MRPASSCMCQFKSPIKTNTRFVILMHPMEFKKRKNGTGLLTHLQLLNSEVVVDLDFTQNKRVNEIIGDNETDCFVLYPGNDSINISRADSKNEFDWNRKRVIFLLDATWPIAKKMIWLSKNLHELPFVSFDNNKKSAFKIKQQPHPACLSTIESVKEVIDCLIDLGLENCSTERFLDPFLKMIEYQIDCVRNPDNKNHRKNTTSDLRGDERYKCNPQRVLFFDKKNYSTIE